jgi:alpha-mannosidase
MNLARLSAVLVAVVASAVGVGANEEEPVQRAVAALLIATDGGLREWQYSSDEDGERCLETVTLRASVRAQESTFRRTVRIPEVFAGTRIAGGPARLRFTLSGPVDHLVSVVINGEERARMPVVDGATRHMDYPEVVLTEHVEAGREYDVQLLVTNPGVYPPHEFLDATRTVSFRAAELVLDAAEPMRDRLDALRINLETGDRMLRRWTPSGRLAEKVWIEDVDRSAISPDERDRLRAVLNRAAAELDLHALTSGDGDELLASIEDVYAGLGPVGEFCKRFTIHAVANAHIDLAWLWRTSETVQIAANTFRSVLGNAAEFPELVFAQSQAQAYAWVEQNDPELFRRVQAAERAGNWEVVGGMWAEPDCNIPGGESWTRQFLLAQRYFRDRFGAEVWLGWNPDSFGYNWNMPQLYSKAGIRAFITQKIGWNDTTVFPYHLFWWEAPDGSRILTYFPTGSYTEEMEPERLVDQLMRFERNTGLDEVLVLYGVGDHGGGPNREILQRVRMLQQQPVFPRLVLSRARDFMAGLLARDLSALPVWRDELYLETHRGTLTTQARTKRGNREGEALLETAEKAASIAHVMGREYPVDLLTRAWELLLLDQFHDILPGSSITPVYRDAEADHDLVRRLARRVIDESLSVMADGVAVPDEDWRAVLVFNPLSWSRGGLLTVPLPEDAPERLEVVDESGAVLPAAVFTSDDGLDRSLQFLASPVPSLGTVLFHLRPGSRAATTSLRHDGFTIENRHLRVGVDPETGNITFVFDKGQGREVLAAGEQGNVIQLHENLPSFWDAWNIGYTGRSWTLDKADSIELIDRSPLALTVRVRKSFLGLSKANRAPTEGFPSSFFTQEITLYADSPQLDLRLDVDWWEDHTLLKVAFPFAVDSDVATYEIPYASIERSTRRETPAEKARFEVSVHRWADISGKGYGVSLLNDSKYGMDTHGTTMRLTGLTSPLWPDPFADRGRQRMSCAVYPHPGSWRDARTVELGHEMNLPLVARMLEPRAGEPVEARSFFGVEGNGVVLTAIKRSEDGHGLVLRLVESRGSEVEAWVTMPGEIESAIEVDLLERPLGDADFEGDRLRFVVAAHEIKSFLVSLRSESR